MARTVRPPAPRSVSLATSRRGRAAETVRLIFQRYLALGCVPKLQAGLDARGTPSKQRFLASGRVLGGCSFGRGRTFLARSTFAVGNDSDVVVAMDSEAVRREGHPLPAT
jgi:hypothetical protein